MLGIMITTNLTEEEQWEKGTSKLFDDDYGQT
jgi:hypothetical protein